MDKVIAKKFQKVLESQTVIINEEKYNAVNTPAKRFIKILSDEERLSGFAQALYYLARRDSYDAGEICDAVIHGCTQIPSPNQDK